MRRPLAAVALVAVAVLAGCAGSLPAVDPGGGGPPDPATDRQGWEDGYWHDETLAVDPGDGLSDRELRAVVGRAMARVEVVRDVEFAERVPVSVVTREEFRSRSAVSPDPATRTFDDATLEALLLVGEDADATAVRRANSGTSVQGFYSPGRDEIVVVAAGDAVAVDETTLAHELVHAWQDQRFDLASLDAPTMDARNGRDGLVEGDANLVQFRYRERCGADWDCVLPADDGGGGGSLANYGVFVTRFHPYSDGPGLVAALRAEGGWAAVNAAYADPPASAEQVTHPERYRTDPPTAVTLVDRTAGDWERVRPPGRPAHETVGQAGLMGLFVHPLYDSDGEAGPVTAAAWLNRTAEGTVSDFDPFDYGHPYADGWDGDRLHVYADGSGEQAYVWRLVWDSPADAAEFREGYARTLAYWGGQRVGPDTWVVPDGPFADAFHVERDGDTVTVTNAPTVPALSSVRTSVEPPADVAVTPAPTTDPASATPTATPDAVTTPGFGGAVAVTALVTAAALVAVRRRDGRARDGPG